MKKKILFTIITIFISLLICLVIGEIMAIFLAKPSAQARNDERNQVYRFDEELGWFSIKNSEHKFTGSHLINVKNNDLGFRDTNHGPKAKKRIAFIGDSFVWGYDVEQDQRFTEKLQSKIPNWEVINMGISGYGSDQALILLEKWFDHFQPDVVCLVFCDNDLEDNKTNERYGGYYKPYFKNSNNLLTRHGIPVTKGVNYYYKQYPTLFKSKLMQTLFNANLPSRISMENNPTPMILKAMNDFVISKGAKFFIALTHRMECPSCDSNKIKNLNVTNSFKYETNGKHWTPQGHDFVTEKIFNFLIHENIIDTVSFENNLQNKK